MSRAHRRKHRQQVANRRKRGKRALHNDEIDAITYFVGLDGLIPVGPTWKWVKRRRRWTKKDDKRYQRAHHRTTGTIGGLPRHNRLLDRTGRPVFDMITGNHREHLERIFWREPNIALMPIDFGNDDRTVLVLHRVMTALHRDVIVPPRLIAVDPVFEPLERFERDEVRGWRPPGGIPGGKRKFWQ